VLLHQPSEFTSLVRKKAKCQVSTWERRKRKNSFDEHTPRNGIYVFVSVFYHVFISFFRYRQKQKNAFEYHEGPTPLGKAVLRTSEFKTFSTVLSCNWIRARPRPVLHRIIFDACRRTMIDGMWSSSDPLWVLPPKRTRVQFFFYVKLASEVLEFRMSGESHLPISGGS
jgi:hypothetical protein